MSVYRIDSSTPIDDAGIRLADAAIAAVRDQAFDRSFVISREWDPYRALHDAALSQPQVWLIPQDHDASKSAGKTAGACTYQEDLTLWLIVQQRTKDDKALLDKAACLAAAIHDFLTQTPLDITTATAHWQATNSDGHDVELLHQSGLYWRGYQMTWRAFRP